MKTLTVFRRHLFFKNPCGPKTSGTTKFYKLTAQAVNRGRCIVSFMDFPLATLVLGCPVLVSLSAVTRSAPDWQRSGGLRCMTSVEVGIGFCVKAWNAQYVLQNESVVVASFNRQRAAFIDTRRNPLLPLHTSVLFELHLIMPNNCEH